MRSLLSIQPFLKLEIKQHIKYQILNILGYLGQSLSSDRSIAAICALIPKAAVEASGKKGMKQSRADLQPVCVS
jgi:hypothetical protein